MLDRVHACHVDAVKSSFHSIFKLDFGERPLNIAPEWARRFGALRADWLSPSFTSMPSLEVFSPLACLLFCFVFCTQAASGPSLGALKSVSVWLLCRAHDGQGRLRRDDLDHRRREKLP